MREILFRAWDKERQEMREVKLMDWSAWWVSTGSTWERDEPLTYGERNSFKNEESDRHNLMQYTGLKDKNGKEIYEGDIVKQFSAGIHADPEDFEIKVVTWSEVGWSPFVDMVGGARHDYSFNLFQYEVIGNIYEHPHLLEGRDEA